MLDPGVLLFVGATTGVAWLPVFLRFARNWVDRGHPLSLAIAGLILFALYTPVYLVTELPTSWPVSAVVVLDAMCCGLFYAGTWCAAKLGKEGVREDDLSSGD